MLLEEVYRILLGMLTRRRTRDIQSDTQHDHLDAKRKSKTVGSEIRDLEPPKVKLFSRKY